MAGRPKRTKAYKVVLVIPKDTLYYRAKRTYWLVREMEKKLELSPTAIKMKDYFEALDRYAELCKQLKDEGYKDGKAQKRMDNEGMGKDRLKASAPDMGNDQSPELGDGVSTLNPLT